MLHIPWVGYSLPVVGLLDASKDEVANVKESLLNVVIMIATYLMAMTGLSHDGRESLFLEAVEVDTTCLFSFSFLVELDAWSSEGNVGRWNGF
jgi:hypothetical protein